MWKIQYWTGFGWASFGGVFRWEAARMLGWNLADCGRTVRYFNRDADEVRYHDDLEGGVS